ncbi:hypothetical protein BDR03DRAFT_971941 [Suillus americanus]|nr:hypothetical protein BDR03DRAFT_971941 [Suillus americanus]
MRAAVLRYWRDDWRREIFGRGKGRYPGSSQVVVLRYWRNDRRREIFGRGKGRYPGSIQAVVLRYWRNDRRREIFGRGKGRYPGSIGRLMRVIQHFWLVGVLDINVIVGCVRPSLKEMQGKPGHTY